MTAAFAKLKSHFTTWREWELNPIVIKELRQGVRSWTVTGMLLLFLAILFIASLGFLVTESFDINPNMGLGGVMFSWFMAILAGASVFFIPLYTGVRVAAERQENNPDLLYVTTLSPVRIILGKFLCSAYLVLLFFSACMPFMAFTNLLRGVDLPTVFYILGFLFLVVCLANMIAIFLACLPLSRPFKFLFIIGGIFASGYTIVELIIFSVDFMREGVGGRMTHGVFDRHADGCGAQRGPHGPVLCPLRGADFADFGQSRAAGAGLCHGILAAGRIAGGPMDGAGPRCRPDHGVGGLHVYHDGRRAGGGQQQRRPA